MFRKSFIKSLIKQCENEIKFVNGIKTALNAERYVVNIESEKTESEFEPAFEPASDELNKQIKKLYIHEINLLEMLANTIVTGLVGGMIDCSIKFEIKLNEIVDDLDSCKEFLMKEYTDHYDEFPEFKR